MNDYDGPLYSPYDNLLMGKLTKSQWKLVEECVRDIQCDNVNNQPYYHQLREVLVILQQLSS